MSRIGNKVINVPAGVSVEVTPTNLVLLLDLKEHYNFNFQVLLQLKMQITKLQ